MVWRNNKSCQGNEALLLLLSSKTQKKSQADSRPGLFWLKLSAGGQLDGYFEYVAGAGAGVSFF
jgi:hypothetical protein